MKVITRFQGSDGCRWGMRPAGTLHSIQWQFHIDVSGPDCPETSVRNNHPTLRNPKERSSMKNEVPWVRAFNIGHPTCAWMACCRIAGTAMCLAAWALWTRCCVKDVTRVYPAEFIFWTLLYLDGLKGPRVTEHVVRSLSLGGMDEFRQCLRAPRWGISGLLKRGR